MIEYLAKALGLSDINTPTARAEKLRAQIESIGANRLTLEKRYDELRPIAAIAVNGKQSSAASELAGVTTALAAGEATMAELANMLRSEEAAITTERCNAVVTEILAGRDVIAARRDAAVAVGAAAIRMLAHLDYTPKAAIELIGQHIGTVPAPDDFTTLDNKANELFSLGMESSQVRQKLRGVNMDEPLHRVAVEAKHLPLIAKQAKEAERIIAKLTGYDLDAALAAEQAREDKRIAALAEKVLAKSRWKIAVMDLVAKYDTEPVDTDERYSLIYNALFELSQLQEPLPRPLTSKMNAYAQHVKVVDSRVVPNRRDRPALAAALGLPIWHP